MYHKDAKSLHGDKKYKNEFFNRREHREMITL